MSYFVYQNKPLKINILFSKSVTVDSKDPTHIGDETQLGITEEGGLFSAASVG